MNTRADHQKGYGRENVACTATGWGRLIDATLREGDQAYGVYFTAAMKREIVSGLVLAGVDEIELGSVGQEELPELAAWARERSNTSVLSVWSPCRESDVRAAAAMGFDRINVGVPSSDRHMNVRLKLGRTGVIDRMQTVIRTARDMGISYVSVGLEDCSRADEGFLVRAAKAAAQAGASRVRLADTVGLMTPLALARLVRVVTERVGIDVAVHCHNDMGMATANAVTALEAGAAYADVSVLGLGERAGIAAMEEVMAHLAFHAGEPGDPSPHSEIDKGAVAATRALSGRYNVSAAVALCRSVAMGLDRAIPVDKPIVGKKIFACETGLHVHGVLNDPALFEPFSPELAGHTRVVGVGRKSGRAAVAETAKRLGVPVTERMLPALTRAVRMCSSELGRPLTDPEFLALCAECLPEEKKVSGTGKKESGTKDTARRAAPGTTA